MQRVFLSIQVLVLVLLIGFSQSAIIRVTSGGDESNGEECTLRGAITNANNNNRANPNCEGGSGSEVDIIIIPSGLQITLTTAAMDDTNEGGDLDIRDSVIIEAQGDGAAITTKLQDRIFDIITGVDPAMTVVFNNLIIYGGVDASTEQLRAGGIRGGGANITLENVRFTNNAVELGSDVTPPLTVGSAFVSSGPFRGENVTLDSNAVRGNITEGSVVGGIVSLYNGPDVVRMDRFTVISNIIENIEADVERVSTGLIVNAPTFMGSGEGSDNKAINGGVLFLTGNVTSAHFTMTGPVFNNHAQNGAVIYRQKGEAEGVVNIEFAGYNVTNNEAKIKGGAFCGMEARITITAAGGSITDNYAGEGGAVYADGDVSITGVDTITRNSALDDGGAIYSNSAVTLSIVNDIVDNHSTRGYGGAVYGASDVYLTSEGAIIGNTAGQNGGAICSYGALTATLAKDIVDNNANLNGGALYSLYDSYITCGGSIIGNTAYYGGGAINSYAAATISVAHNISDNHIYMTSGGVISASGDIYLSCGGSITGNSAVDYGGVINTNGGVTIEIANDISDNRANNHWGGVINAGADVNITSGGFITRNTARDFGGVIYTYGAVTISIAKDISDNRSETGAGGVIYTHGDVNITCGGSITRNTASQFGGAIATEGSVTISITKDISDNHAKGSYGGAMSGNGIYITSSGAITGNTAYTDGGAIRSRFVKISIAGDIKDNYCGRVGGAIDSNGDIHIVSEGSIERNSAYTTGGAIYSGASIYMTIAKDISNNYVNESNAGAIYATGDVTLTARSITGNIAEQSGGAIYALGAVNVSVTTDISGNKATQEGGVIYANGDILFNNVRAKITSNEAEGYGGVLYSDTGNIRGEKIFWFHANDALDGALAYSKGNITLTNVCFITENIASGGSILTAEGDAVEVSVQSVQNNMPDDRASAGGSPISLTVNPPSYSASIELTGVNSNGYIAQISVQGSGNYTYEWFNGETTQSISGIQTGEIHALVYDTAEFCPVVVTYTIPNPVADAGADQEVDLCVTNQITLGGSPSGIGGTPEVPSPYVTYEWSPASAFTDDPSQVYNANPQVIPVEGETLYTVRVTDQFTGVTVSDSVVITAVDSQLVVDAGAVGTNSQGVYYICPSSSVLLQAEVICGATEDMKYTWTPAIGLNNASSLQPTASPSQSTLYTLTVEGDGREASDSVMVQVSTQQVQANASPVEGVDSYRICEGDSIVLGGANQPNQNDAQSYVWTPSSGLSDPTIGNPVATPTTSTVYTLTATSPDGCSVSSDTVEVIVDPNTVGVNAGGIQEYSIYAGQSVLLQPVISYSGSETLEYLWSPSEGLSDPTVLNPIATPYITTLYTLSVTGDQGCAFGSGSVRMVLIDSNNDPSSSGSWMLAPPMLAVQLFLVILLFLF